MSVLSAAEKMPGWARVLPIVAGDKRPAINDWPNKATNDHEVHVTWWGNGTNYGIGWKMGAQADGRFLIAIDVDAKSGGLASIGEWLTGNGLVEEFFGTVCAQSGGGGKHFIFEIDPALGERFHNSARIMPGVDIRSEAGQIVIAPTIHPSGKPYYWATGHAPGEIEPSRASATLIAELLGLLVPPAAATTRPVPALDTPGRSSPADYVREKLDWHTYLSKWGWTYLRTDGEGDSYWKRPGKTDRGHSAVLHPSGALVIFTSEITPELARLGKSAKGVGLSVSLFSFIAAYEHGGDEPAYGRWVREQPWFDGGSDGGWAFVEASGPPPSPGDPNGEAERQEPDRSPLLPTLDDDFWSARPWLTQIRQAAHARGISADAVLVNVLAIYAATIPPEYMTKDMIGTPGSLNYLACVVGPSGIGKTQAYRIGRELVGEPPHPKVRFGAQPGSGEGVIKAYMADEKGIDPVSGDKVTLKVQAMQGIHWYVDEGTALANTAKRGEGSTILQTICSGWSGSALGQENATSENWRRLDGDKYRLTASVSIQRDLAHEFHNEYMQSLGLTGRAHFISVVDPAIPTVRPERPGPLSLKVWPGITLGKRIIDFPTEVEDQLWVEHVKAGRGEVTINPTESQHKLLRCKLAALVAMIEQRLVVSLDDWALAGTMLGTSARLVGRLESEHSERSAARLRANGVARAVTELASEERKEARYVADLADKIVAKVLINGRTARSDLRKGVSSKQRHRFEAALNLALSNGRVALDGQAVVPPN